MKIRVININITPTSEYTNLSVSRSRIKNLTVEPLSEYKNLNVILTSYVTGISVIGQR